MPTLTPYYVSAIAYHRETEQWSPRVPTPTPYYVNPQENNSKKKQAKPQCTYYYAIWRERHRKPHKEAAREASRYIYSHSRTWPPSMTTVRGISESCFFETFRFVFWDLLVFFETFHCLFWDLLVFFETFPLFFLRPSFCFFWDLTFFLRLRRVCSALRNRPTLENYDISSRSNFRRYE